MAEKVGGVYYDCTMDTRGLIVAEREARKRIDGVGGEFDRLEAKATKVAAAVSAAMATIALGGLASKLIETQRQFDVLFSSLKTVTGGAQAANVQFEKLREFASSTPYSLDQTVQGFIKLKSLGLDPSERSMRSFGNTASAMGKSLNQMIEAVADAATGEFERLKEFGIRAKVQGDQVSLTFQGVTTTVRNSSREISEYLTKIGEENFAGAMSERMKTLDGDISNLQDSLQGLYLSISQSGFGDAVAAGVRRATEAIQEAEASVKQGELTEYFDNLRPLIVGAELAVVTLAGAITGRLIQAMLAAGVQAYASAAAMGAATVATRGFTAALAVMGGPIGLAVTGLALLALNWDKLAGSAKSAAEVSENAAGRIAAALAQGGRNATRALSAELESAKKTLADLDGEIAAGSVRSIYGDRAPVAGEKKLAELKAQRDEVAKVVADIQTAMGNVYGSGRRPANEGGGGLASRNAPESTGETGGKVSRSASRTTNAIEDAEADFQQRINAWWRANEEALDLAEERAAQQAKDDAQRLANQRASGQAFALDLIADGDPLAELAVQTQRKSDMLREAAERDLENADLYAAARVALEQRTNERIRQIIETEEEKKRAAQNAMLQSYGGLFGGMADMVKAFGGEQSRAYKVLFAASKAFAIAESIVNIQAGIAKALNAPFPQNIVQAGMVASQAAGLIATIKGTNYGGGRQYGGPTSAGTLYRVNETGAPEMFTAANGSQYMLPTAAGRVTPADQVGAAGGPAWQIVINNAPPGTTATVDNERRIVAVAVAQAKAEIAGEISSNQGQVYRSLRSATSLQPKL